MHTYSTKQCVECGAYLSKPKYTRCGRCSRTRNNKLRAKSPVLLPCRCGCGGFSPRGLLRGHNRRMVGRKPKIRRIRQPRHTDVHTTYTIDPSTGCWNWKRHLTQSGYGEITCAGVHYVAHRWVYEELVGPIPEGLQLDHLCRNRGCVNPAHLEPVTPRENTRRSSATKLNAADIVAIRGIVGMSQRAIAAQYGVSESLISLIRRGKHWKDVEAA